MAVLAQQRLDDVEQAAVRHHALAGGAAVQHLVAEVLALVLGELGVADVSRDVRVDRFDLRAPGAELVGVERTRPQGPALALELRARLIGHVVAKPQVDRVTRDHVASSGGPISEAAAVTIENLEGGCHAREGFEPPTPRFEAWCSTLRRTT